MTFSKHNKIITALLRWYSYKEQMVHFKIVNVHAYPEHEYFAFIRPPTLSSVLSLHTQYVGCRLVVSPTLPTTKALALAKTVVKKSRKSNKRRVTMTFTAETVYVSDMMYRVSSTLIHMVYRQCK